MSSEHPDPEMADYRPVSGIGIAALLIGLAAPLALVHPMLWCVPAIGAGVAIVALVRIRRSEIPLIGRKAAILGLVLSLLFVTLRRPEIIRGTTGSRSGLMRWGRNGSTPFAADKRNGPTT